MRPQKVHVPASGKMRAEPVVNASAQHPGKCAVRPGNTACSLRGHGLIEMRSAELHFAKRIQLVFVRPFGAEKDARPNQSVLQMAMNGKQSQAGELKSPERGRIPGGFIETGNRYSLGKEERAIHGKAIGSVIAGHVSPPAADLQPLSSRGCGEGKCRKNKQNQDRKECAGGDPRRTIRHSVPPVWIAFI